MRHPTERDQTRVIEQSAKLLCRYVLRLEPRTANMEQLASDLLRILELRDSRPVIGARSPMGVAPLLPCIRSELSYNSDDIKEALAGTSLPERP